MHENIDSILKSYKSVTLKEIDSVGFMNRIDTKFHFDVELIPLILERCKHDYSVLEINEMRSMPYRTTYFDTPDFKLYLSHVNGLYNRFKVRHREYQVSGDSFFEVKFKNNKSRTTKSRIANNNEHILNDISDTFLHQQTQMRAHHIQSALTNKFYRITLVSRSMDARITLDYDISFASKENHVGLPLLGIAEIKHGGGANKPLVISLLKQMGIHPDGVSKYCIGVALLFKGLKYNLLKEKLLHINKIHNGKLNFARKYKAF